MNGAGSCGPGPAGPGARGPGAGGGAAAGFAGAGPGSGASGSVRAPGGPGAIGTGVPGTSGCTCPGRPAIGIPGVGGRPSGFGGERRDVGQCRVRPVRSERALRVLVDTRTRQRVTRPRQTDSGVGVYEHGDPGATRRSRMIRGALEHRRRRRRRTVGEPGAVGVGEPERRQPGTAPEVLRVDTALLERGIDPRLQGSSTAAGWAGLTLKYGPDATASFSDAANLPIST